MHFVDSDRLRRLGPIVWLRGLAASPSGQVVLRTVVVASAVVLGTWWLMRKGLISYDFTDLHVYYSAMNWWVNDDLSLYDFTTYIKGYELGFTYPPFAAVVFSPFSFISLATAEIIFTQAAMVSFAAAGWWLISPLVERYDWPRLFTFCLAVPLIFVLEPIWVTITIGQINWLLFLLIIGDAILLSRGSRWTGIGIGLAAAIKITPGIFVLYLLITRRFRASVTAVITAAVATLAAAAISPAESWRFWTQAIWDTERIGSAERVDNQSLMGFLARITDTSTPNRLLWLGCVLVVLGFGLWRARKAWQSGDEIVGLTLTGLVGALASPISWIHHLLWLVPAIIIFLSSGLQASAARQRWFFLSCATAIWLLTASTPVWELFKRGDVLGWLGSNAYVLAILAIIAILPIRHNEPKHTISPVREPAIPEPHTDSHAGDQPVNALVG